MAREPQDLTAEQLQTTEGVLVLNNLLRELFTSGNLTVFQYGDSAASSASTYMKGLDGIVFTSTIGYRMPRKGSIIRHSVLADITTATSGDVTFEVYINDTNQSSLELEFNSSDGTGVASKDTQVDRHSVTFDAGDILTFHATETGTMAWTNVLGSAEVVFDD